MNKINYGIISTASIVPRFISAVREVGEGNILAIASRDGAKAKNFAEKYGINKSYGTYDDLYNDKEINVVYIATINSEHYKNCLEALKHGKNVICEKPFTKDKQEAEHLFELAKSKGLFIIEAQKSVFLPASIKVKEIIESGRIGEVHLVDFSSSSDPGYNKWINSIDAGGGTLYGNASYFLHLSKFWFEDNPRDVIGLSNIHPEGADSQCIISFKIGKKTMVVSKISYDIRTVDKAIIYGKDGRIEIPEYWKARKFYVYDKDGNCEEFEFPATHELKYEIAHIEECLKAGKLQSPVMDSNMTISTIDLMEKLRKQWY